MKNNINNKIYNLLLKEYPSPSSELNFANLYQLFVSVMLSAQCTDKRVNTTTPELFHEFPDFIKLAHASEDQVMKIIKSCGLYKTKAKNLINSAKLITDEFSGKIPSQMQQLQTLPGIGRKSANVIMGVGFRIPAFPVDTHVSRISVRLGWSQTRNPLNVEREVTGFFPKEKWINLHHALIKHGRYTCKARKPLCHSCCINDFCPSKDSF